MKKLNELQIVLDTLQKSIAHKYIRREGTTGNYKYIYHNPETKTEYSSNEKPKSEHTKAYKMLGTSDEETTCHFCGKEHLKYTVAFEQESTGKICHAGSECAKMVTGLTEKETQDKAKEIDKALVIDYRKKLNDNANMLLAEKEIKAASEQNIPYPERPLGRWRELKKQAENETKALLGYEVVGSKIIRDKNIEKSEQLVDLLDALNKSLKGKTPTFSGYTLDDKYSFQGMQISIENSKGSTRHWESEDGTSGDTTMKFDYGYIRNTLGRDKDHVDCYIGNNPESSTVYVIHQVKPTTNTPDEDKAMLGFDSEAEAKAAYLAHIPTKFFGSMNILTVDEFKDKVIGKEVKMIKSMAHKYIRREGTPGNYTYIYFNPVTKQEYSQNKAPEQENNKQSETTDWNPEIAMFVRNWANKGGKTAQLGDIPSSIMKNLARTLGFFSPEYAPLFSDAQRVEKTKDMKALITRFESEETKAWKGYEAAAKYFPEVKKFYNAITKDQNLTKSLSHKYIKRTGTPGNYNYIYDLPEGHDQKERHINTFVNRQLKDKVDNLNVLVNERKQRDPNYNISEEETNTRADKIVEEHVGMSRDLAEKRIKDIDEKNYGSLSSALHPGNPNSLKLFKEYTGVDLGKTVGSINENLKKFVGAEVVQTHEANAKIAKEKKDLENIEADKKWRLKEIEGNFDTERGVNYENKHYSKKDFFDHLITSNYTFTKDKNSIRATRPDGKGFLKFSSKDEKDYIRLKTGLAKSDLEYVLDILEKSRQAFPVGTRRTWAGQDYIKHADGWVAVAGPHHGKMLGKFKEEPTHKDFADSHDKVPAQEEVKPTTPAEPEDKLLSQFKSDLESGKINKEQHETLVGKRKAHLEDMLAKEKELQDEYNKHLESNKPKEPSVEEKIIANEKRIAELEAKMKAASEAEKPVEEPKAEPKAEPKVEAPKEEPKVEAEQPKEKDILDNDYVRDIIETSSRWDNADKLEKLDLPDLQHDLRLNSKDEKMAAEMREAIGLIEERIKDIRKEYKATPKTEAPKNELIGRKVTIKQELQDRKGKTQYFNDKAVITELGNGTMHYKTEDGNGGMMSERAFMTGLMNGNVVLDDPVEDKPVAPTKEDTTAKEKELDAEVDKRLEDIKDIPDSPEVGEKPLTPAEEKKVAGPRTQESAQLKKDAEDDSQYAFARKSAVGNLGEDVLYSARHRRNEFKGLEDAESSGNAAKIITRDNLLDNNPTDFISDCTTENMTLKLTSHLAVKNFPPAPNYGAWIGSSAAAERMAPETIVASYWRKLDGSISKLPNMYKMRDAEKIGSITKAEYDLDLRKTYLQTFESVRSKIEELSKSDNINNFNTALKDHCVAMVHSLRAKNGSQDPTAQALAGYVNNKLYAGRGGIYQEALDISKKAQSATQSPEQHLEVVKQVLEGKTIDKALGTATGKKRTQISLASLYVDHATRKGPEHAELATQESQTKYLTEKTKLRGMQWGNSVTDEERAHHLKQIPLAFKDLSEVLGIPESAVSYNGKLALAIGARGKGSALAHYEPALQVINLTRKNGVGSLAHEWGHMLDNIVTQAMGNTRRDKDVNYLSEMATPTKWNRETQAYETKDVHPLEAAMSGVTRSEAWGTYKKEILKTLQDDKGSSIPYNGDYWLSGREMFARAFESYVNNKLEDMGRQNTYLSSGPGYAGLWGSPETQKALQPLFDKFFETFAKSEEIHKAMSELLEMLRKGDNMGKGSKPAQGHEHDIEAYKKWLSEIQAEKKRVQKADKKELKKHPELKKSETKVIGHKTESGNMIVGHTKTGKEIPTHHEKLTGIWDAQDHQDAMDSHYQIAQKLGNKLKEKKAVDANFVIPSGLLETLQHHLDQVKLHQEALEGKQVKKSEVSMDRQGTDIDTGSFAMENEHAPKSKLFKEIHDAFEGDYPLFSDPKTFELGNGRLLHVTKVDEGMYSGFVRKEAQGLEGVIDTVLKFERETLPTMMQHLIAKQLMDNPMIPVEVASNIEQINIDKKIQMLQLLVSLLG